MLRNVEPKFGRKKRNRSGELGGKFSGKEEDLGIELQEQESDHREKEWNGMDGIGNRRKMGCLPLDSSEFSPILALFIPLALSAWGQ